MGLRIFFLLKINEKISFYKFLLRYLYSQCIEVHYLSLYFFAIFFWRKVRDKYFFLLKSAEDKTLMLFIASNKHFTLLFSLCVFMCMYVCLWFEGIHFHKLFNMIIIIYECAISIFNENGIFYILFCLYSLLDFFLLSFFWQKYGKIHMLYSALEMSFMYFDLCRKKVKCIITSA